MLGNNKKPHARRNANRGKMYEIETMKLRRGSYACGSSDVERGPFFGSFNLEDWGHPERAA